MKLPDVGRLLLLAALWGGSYLFIRVAAPVLGVLLTIGLRVTLAAVALVVFAAATHQFPDVRQRWRAYLVLGALNNAVPFVLIAVAVVQLNASIAAILNATTPLFTAVIAAVWLKERLNWWKISGLVLGIVGVAILVGWSPIPVTWTVLGAALCALVAALSYGIAAVYARRTFTQSKPLETATGQLLGSSVLLLPVAFISTPTSAPPVGVILAVVALALVCTAFAYLLYFQLIAQVGATQAATVTFLVPVFSLIWGSMLLGEPVNAGIIAGLVTILLSVWLVLAVRPSVALGRA